MEVMPGSTITMGGSLPEGLDTGVSNASVPGQKRAREDESSLVDDKKWPGWPGDNVFRLIVPTHKVGSIIGRKGEIVKKMCEETRSRIKILDGLPGTPERVVMVSARDEPEAAISPAMDGILKVHRRIIEGSEIEGDGAVTHPPFAVVSSKLLVAATQAGNLIGRQGATIKVIQDAAGANVRVLSVEEVPSYALPDDRVVEIQGEVGKVLKAMEMVISHLRKFLVDRSILPMFEINKSVQTQSHQQAAPQGSWGPSSATSYPSTASVGANYNTSSYQHESYYQSSEAFEPPVHHGLSVYGRDPGVGAMSSQISIPPPVPIITQVTQKMQIPLSYADSIIGTAGANISYMRRTSGATITIQETRGVHGEMTVEIHGTATQVQTAQQLIQSSMAGPVPSYTPIETSYGSYNSQSIYPSGAGGSISSGYGSTYSGSYGY